MRQWGVAKVGKQEPQLATWWDGIASLGELKAGPRVSQVGRFGLSVPGSWKQVIVSLFLP